MDHEITVALISLSAGVIIALIGVASTMMVSRNTRKVAEHKKDVEDQLAEHRHDVEELARKTARKAEVTALKLRIDQLEKENARLRRRVTCLDKALRARTNEPTDCDD